MLTRIRKRPNRQSDDLSLFLQLDKMSRLFANIADARSLKTLIELYNPVVVMSVLLIRQIYTRLIRPT